MGLEHTDPGTDPAKGRCDGHAPASFGLREPKKSITTRDGRDI